MGGRNLTRLTLDVPLERGFAERAVVREPKRVWSWSRLHEEACRTGVALLGLGLRPGDRLALLLHDSAELAATFLGAVRAGIVPVPMSVLLRPLDLRALLVDAGARAIVVAADLAAGVEQVRAEVPALAHVLAIGGARPGQVDLHALTREADPQLKVHEPNEGEPAFILYSAGTGGPPRGVPHTHEAPRHAFAAYAEAVLKLSSEDRVFNTAGLGSAYGLGMGILFPLQAGATTFLLPARPRPRTVFDVLNTFRPTVFSATPSLYGQMLQDWKLLPAPRSPCFQSVRHAISGAEPLPPQLAARVKSTFGVELLHGFGVTEALTFVLANRPGLEHEGSVGQPLRGVEARLVDESGRTLQAQEIGLLEVRGPQVARSYVGASDTPKGVFHDGWVRTGDRFLVDDHGWWFHCGRADDLFKVSGRWVSPEEVERTLLAHPAVWECAVVEGHDEDGLARPVAFVVPNVGHEPGDELGAQLTEFVKREIAPYKYPREIVFVRELPKSPDGRVARWRLRRGAK